MEHNNFVNRPRCILGGHLSGMEARAAGCEDEETAADAFRSSVSATHGSGSRQVTDHSIVSLLSTPGNEFQVPVLQPQYHTWSSPRCAISCNVGVARLPDALLGSSRCLETNCFRSVASRHDDPQMQLEAIELWRAFRSVNTEMVITKSGRSVHSFGTLSLFLLGLL